MSSLLYMQHDYKYYIDRNSYRQVQVPKAKTAQVGPSTNTIMNKWTECWMLFWI